MILLRHHLHQGLKNEYLIVKKTVVLPKSHYEWTHLRLQDYNSVIDYNFAMFQITSQMKLYGEPISEDLMLEKTFSTFHAINMVLQQLLGIKDFKQENNLEQSCQKQGRVRYVVWVRVH